MKILILPIVVLVLFVLNLSSPVWYEVTEVNGEQVLFTCETGLCVNKDLGIMYEGVVPDFTGGEYQTVHSAEGYGIESECAVLRKGNVYDKEVLCEYSIGFLNVDVEIVDFEDIYLEFI